MTKKISLAIMFLCIVASFFMFTGYAQLSDSVTINGTVSASAPEFDINWYNYDKTLLETDTNVIYGSTPSYDGELPTREADQQYHYEFRSWTILKIDANQNEHYIDVIIENEVITDDINYYASYTPIVNKYTVTWVNWDDSVLKSGDVEYGQTPVAPADPTRAKDAQYTYTFAGWEPTIEPVTGNITYKAYFNATVNKYVVEFVNWDGTVLQSSEYEYGKTPVYSGSTPTKPATAEDTFTFAGWDKVISAVTGDVTYVAEFIESD